MILFILTILLNVGYSSCLTDAIDKLPFDKETSFPIFGLSFSSNHNLLPLQDELFRHNLKLQIVDCVQERSLDKQLKETFKSANVSSYLLAQILAHLHVYRHGIDHLLPYALVVEPNAFLYNSPHQLNAILEELTMNYPDWDILFTDVHYHLPKDGSLLKP